MAVQNPSVDVTRIRTIQALMALCSIVPQKGKLRKLFELALAVQEDEVVNRITPAQDLSPHGLKGWLESVYAQEGITEAEQKLIDWQNDSDNMTAALQELKDFEQVSGIRLALASAL